ncbi:ABC transporter substrate-binding protein [Paenibacillus mendelii]|uniref:ABC transporter substrate-binding protein n=1 Tax=Paenibacillus mendelii TaxID=206163 RepID=A0ABV6J6X6_9BACL|nr:ABC transporter substrate-binding protein [Paenibacillus mendelii]MCQ6561798.1 ABC transporter substrate-binding protein [Paenibacillus mendelii]
MYRSSKPSLTAVMLVCVALLISACQAGGNTTNNANDRSSYSAPSAVQNETSPVGNGNETAATRVFKHLYGETAIPKQPKRIVTAFHLGQLMALGVRPLGSSTYILQNPVLDTEGMEDLGVPLNLEKISSLEPDLIILVDAYVEMSGGYDVFSKIAPTIVIEPYYDPVKDIAQMGDILGKEDEAKRWIEEFEKKIAAAKQQVHDAIDVNETFTIVSFYEKSPRVYRDENMGGNILYKYLGLKPQQKVLSDLINSGQKPPYAEVSSEVVSDFVGDNLFMAVNEENKAAFESFKSTGIWSNMKAVKNNKVYTIDYDLFLQSDPIAVTKQVEILTKILIDKNE